MKLSKYAMQRALRVYRKRPARSKAELDRVHRREYEQQRYVSQMVRIIVTEPDVINAALQATSRRVRHGDVYQIISDAARLAALPGGVLSFYDIIRKINDLPGTPEPLHWAQRSRL